MNTHLHPSIEPEKFHVIIESIGKANPSASKVLSDVLGTPVEHIVKALYNAPTVLFSNIDSELAEQCEELLKKLGMEARLQNAVSPIPVPGESIDVGIYIEDISTIPIVTEKLSTFLGCSQNEAFNLLIQDPCIVMGGVSLATAEALCKRLETEIIISNPKKDLYGILIDSKTDNALILHKFQSHLTYLKLDVDLKKTNEIRNLSYEAAQDLWKKFQSSGFLKIINQSFQRYEINLTEVDKTNTAFRETLTKEVGIPPEIIDKVIENLPIQLEASVNGRTVADKLALFSAAGLKCATNIIKPNNYKLIIESNPDLKRSRSVLSRYLDENELPVNDSKWEFPRPLGDLIYRYIAHELTAIHCVVDYNYYSI